VKKTIGAVINHQKILAGLQARQLSSGVSHAMQDRFIHHAGQALFIPPCPDPVFILTENQKTRKSPVFSSVGV
jgi:hypothetical protein